MDAHKALDVLLTALPPHQAQLLERALVSLARMAQRGEKAYLVSGRYEDGSPMHPFAVAADSAGDAYYLVNRYLDALYLGAEPIVGAPDRHDFVVRTIFGKEDFLRGLAELDQAVMGREEVEEAMRSVGDASMPLQTQIAFS